MRVISFLRSALNTITQLSMLLSKIRETAQSHHTNKNITQSIKNSYGETPKFLSPSDVSNEIIGETDGKVNTKNKDVTAIILRKM